MSGKRLFIPLNPIRNNYRRVTVVQQPKIVPTVQIRLFSKSFIQKQAAEPQVQPISTPSTPSSSHDTFESIYNDTLTKLDPTHPEIPKHTRLNALARTVQSPSQLDLVLDLLPKWKYKQLPFGSHTTHLILRATQKYKNPVTALELLSNQTKYGFTPDQTTMYELMNQFREDVLKTNASKSESTKSQDETTPSPLDCLFISYGLFSHFHLPSFDSTALNFLITTSALEGTEEGWRRAWVTMKEAPKEKLKWESNFVRMMAFLEPPKLKVSGSSENVSENEGDGVDRIKLPSDFPKAQSLKEAVDCFEIVVRGEIDESGPKENEGAEENNKRDHIPEFLDKTLLSEMVLKLKKYVIDSGNSQLMDKTKKLFDISRNHGGIVKVVEDFTKKSH
ncbi:hypothetical protein BKA69DRAFT_1066118 [Paraphysoderma sedebokerense]|nr:hypothetical protein BKA69DRAFT_1066118 [Paraphysoderma sedebokerense]